MHVLIVGAGIGGLCAAVGLVRAGIRVTVVEQADELAEVGAGITIWANAVSALEELGLAAAVAAAGQPDLGGVIRDATGRTLAGFTPAALQTRLGRPNVALHRADLQLALAEALESIQPGAVRLAARCTGVDQRASQVVAEVAIGGTVAEVGADLLVGCDGLHSRVRAALRGDRPPRYAGYVAWRGVTPAGSVDPDLGGGESWGCGQRFGFLPITRGRVYWFATANAPEPQEAGGDWKPQLLERFASWHRPVEALIEATAADAIRLDGIYDRPPTRAWGDGRVTVLGDAAHPMTPNLGQGACQAIEDAAVLARCLARLGSPPDPTAIAAALRHYERARQRRTATIVRASRLVGRLGQVGHPLACRLRNRLLLATPPAARLRMLARLAGADAYRPLTGRTDRRGLPRPRS